MYVEGGLVSGYKICSESGVNNRITLNIQNQFIKLTGSGYFNIKPKYKYSKSKHNYINIYQ